MEIVIFCALPDNEGRFTLHVEPNQIISKVIRAFCRENEIKFDSGYVLKSRAQEELNKKQTLSAYGIQTGDEFFLMAKEDGHWGCGCNQWWMMVFVCLAIGCIGIVAVSVLISKNYDPVHSYGIGIDAGSSHTKLYVYRWVTGKSNGTGIVDEIFTCPSKSGEYMPPLSSFANNASEAGKQCVKPCLDKALNVVPSKEHYRTPVLLGATAGMRMLRISDNKSVEAIMASVRETIALYPFKFDKPQQQARIIEGSEEGAFSWVTTNYLSGTLGFHPMNMITNLWQLSSTFTHTIGALDMGGASTQITFKPESPSSLIEGYNATLILYGVTYHIYTYSHLCYGANEAYRRHLAQLVKDPGRISDTFDEPCSPQGFSFNASYKEIFQVPCTLTAGEPIQENKTVTFLGTSDTKRCHELTLKLFNKTVPCKYPSCSFNGVYQPHLFDNFLAFSGFYYTMNFLNLTQWPNFTLADFENARDAFCNKTMNEVRKLKQTRYLLTYCFNSHFIYNLLVNGYGFNDSNWNSIQFNNKVNGAELGWILGMMINTTNIIPSSAKIEMITLPVFIILIVLFAIFLLLSFAFVVYARRWSRRDYRALPSSAEAIA